MEWVIGIAGVGLVIWVSVLSVIVTKLNRLLQKLIPGSDDPSLKSKFIQLLKDIEEINEREEFLAKNFKRQGVENLKNIQKVALKRYNPYQDVGGDQSFTVVLLSGVDSGLVLTSLHTRSGTRIYAKSVIKGVADVELSKEEEQVLEEARK